MTRGLVAAAALLALAVVVLLLAADVRSWQAAITSGDVIYASNPKAASWTPSSRVGSLAERLVGAEDDVRIRRALRLYAIAAATHLRLDNATEVQTARAVAQDALTATAASSDSERSSQARTLLGLLTYRASATGGEQDQLESAVADFTDAIRADPSNAAAKYDLELLLRLTAAQGTRPGEGLGTGSGRGGRRGAGGGSPGRGY
jgi:hypothetical protein